MSTQKGENANADKVWRRIELHAGEEFRQIRGKVFTYKIRAGSVKPSTTNRLISRSEFEEALGLVPLPNTVPVQHLQGPSYIFAILMDARIRQGEW